jgi:VanZ family protein
LTPGRRGFAWLVLGSAGFTLYGSLVPFHFRALALSDALDVFWAVLAAGVKIDSRSDAVANVLLGVPLGFALLGFVCVDRGRARAKSARLGLFLLPACAAFAACVEFSQLFTTGRTCSASDIVAQTVGSALGMLVWVLYGQRYTDRARAIWRGADVNAAGRLLVAYVALLVFIQTLPFDVSVSPTNLYHKLRGRGPNPVRYVPFGEFDGLSGADRWKQIEKLVKLAGLYFPVGLLLARVKGRPERWNIAHVALAGLALGVCVEGLQLVVVSRTSSATDVLVGALAVVFAWYAARVHHEGLALPFVMSWCIVWLAAMTPVTQAPPDAPRLETPRPFEWMPWNELVSGDPLHALEEALTKLVLFGLLGVLVAAWRLPPRSRRAPGGSVREAVVIATVLGLIAAGFFENSQRWDNTHTPCVTDVLLGGIGAALGVLVASRAKG